MPDVVKLEHINKAFVIRKQKSLKERLVNSRQGRLHDERFVALNDINLTVPAGQSLGLVGPNGSGKSTLLKIIGGILAADSGSALTRGRLAALLELGAGFHPDLSGRENVYLNAAVLGLRRAEIERYFDDIVDFSGIGDFIDTQVKFYSSGMYIRLAFSVAVHVDPDILLVDEVLAVGDVPFQTKCMDKIRQFQTEGRTIVFVSHSASQVADVCNRAIVLEAGHIVADDEPLIALGRLRRDYQNAIDANQSATNHDKSSAQASIARAYLTAPNNYPNGDFQVVMRPGNDLQTICDLNFAAPVADWAISLIVRTTLGQTVLTVDTRKTMDQTLPAVAGPLQATVTLPGLMLGEGEYVVSLQLRDGDDQVIDQLSQVGNVAIRSLKHSLGSVYVEPVVAIEALSAP